MADLLRTGDEGIVGGGIGPDGQPDQRVSLPQTQAPAPAELVTVPGRQGALPGT